MTESSLSTLHARQELFAELKQQRNELRMRNEQLRTENGRLRAQITELEKLVPT